MASFSISDQERLAAIIKSVAAAPWVPFDSTVAEQLAQIAVNSEFSATTGDFMRLIQNSPTGTLLEFAMFAARQIVLEPGGPSWDWIFEV